MFQSRSNVLYAFQTDLYKLNQFLLVLTSEQTYTDWGSSSYIQVLRHLGLEMSLVSQNNKQRQLSFCSHFLKLISWTILKSNWSLHLLIHYYVEEVSQVSQFCFTVKFQTLCLGNIALVWTWWSVVIKSNWLTMDTNVIMQIHSFSWLSWSRWMSGSESMQKPIFQNLSQNNPSSRSQAWFNTPSLITISYRSNSTLLL